jgi:hypothetical protein
MQGSSPFTSDASKYNAFGEGTAAQTAGTVYASTNLTGRKKAWDWTVKNINNLSIWINSYAA